MVALTYDSCGDVVCLHCGCKYTIMFNDEDLNDWISGGKSIQDALYYLSDDERELLISNTCGPCFDQMFPPLDNNE